MRWGQVAVSLAFAIIVAGSAVEVGHPLTFSVPVGILGYLGSRWTITWMFRVRYWVRNEGHDMRTCPKCHQSIYRIAGDWMLRCHRCGWTAGWPGVRWFTRSVPAQQLRRTVVGPGLFVAVLAGAVLVVTVAGFVPVDDATPAGDTEDITVNTTGDLLVVEEPGEAYDTTRVEDLVHEKLNDRRVQRDGYSRLAWNDRAADEARAHAADMAEHDYFKHTALDGETQIERYSFCRGGENIAQTWVERRIETSDGPVTIRSEQELAENIVTIWMHSDPHREDGIYGEHWQSGGVGVAIADGGKVYAVFGFCQ